MGKIATEGEAAKIGGTVTSTPTKGCTWRRAIDLNCEVENTDDVEAEQLVELDKLYKSSENYHFAASAGLLMSIYSSRILLKIEYLLNCIVVGEDNYIDSDDSRDVVEYDYEDEGGKVQSIRFTCLPNSYVQVDSDAPNTRIDYKSGTWKDIYMNRTGSFNQYSGQSIIIVNYEAELLFTFNM